MRLTSWSVSDFTFTVETSQALLANTSQNEWVVESGCIHHMAKDGSLFSSFDNDVEKQIFMVDDFAVNIVSHGCVAC